MSNAVVMRVKLMGSTEDAEKMLRDIVVPAAKAQPGFRSGTWMHDESGNGMGVITFETAEDAEAARAALTPPPGGPELVSSEVWSVGAQA